MKTACEEEGLPLSEVSHQICVPHHSVLNDHILVLDERVVVDLGARALHPISDREREKPSDARVVMGIG